MFRHEDKRFLILLTHAIDCRRATVAIGCSIAEHPEHLWMVGTLPYGGYKHDNFNH